MINNLNLDQEMGSDKISAGFDGKYWSDVSCDIKFYQLWSIWNFGSCSCFRTKIDLTCYCLIGLFYSIFSPEIMVYQSYKCKLRSYGVLGLLSTQHNTFGSQQGTPPSSLFWTDIWNLSDPESSQHLSEHCY